ncbi:MULTISPECIES: hypothetical protein [unclassified Escherichia]|uniref:hypothetical protein n=1 Tax=unclassified Escherichia TaxID=2608889 RepID=UPI001436A5EB|nr:MULTISPECIES: hypothetical protein [unclassified Escherichia]
MLMSPYLVWFHGAALTVMPHVMMADNIIPAPKRHTGIAAARRAAKKRRRAKR